SAHSLLHSFPTRRSSDLYRQAMKEADLEPRFSEIGSEDRELGYLAAKALLARGERPTALFVGTDQAASGVYQALQESGIRIPDEDRKSTRLNSSHRTISY